MQTFPIYRPSPRAHSLRTMACPPPSGTFVTVAESTLIYHHPVCLVYIGVYSWLWTFSGFGQQYDDRNPLSSYRMLPLPQIRHVYFSLLIPSQPQVFLPLQPLYPVERRISEEANRGPSCLGLSLLLLL